MKITLPWMVVLLSLVLTSAHAIDINESLPNIRILAVHEKNVVMLNRGLEDGIQISSHAKLRASEGFVARAVCVKVGMEISYWRLYRVVEPQLVSKDLTYTLIGMDASEAPGNVGTWKSIDHERMFPEKEDKPRALKSDLPDDLTKDEVELAPKSATTQIIEETFDAKKMKRDFRLLSGSLYASPWSIQRGGDTSVEQRRFGGTLSNEGEKYLLDTQLERGSVSARNSATNDKVTTENTLGKARFTVKELTPSWDAFTEVIYRKVQYGELYTPRKHLLIAPVGFLKHLHSGTKVEDLYLSYAPTYESRDDQREGRPDASESGLRHAFGFGLRYKPTTEFTLATEIFWRPWHGLSSWDFDTSDNFSEAKIVASLKVVGSLFLDYHYQWMDDERLRRDNDLPRVVTTQSLNLRYDFNL